MITNGLLDLLSKETDNGFFDHLTLYTLKKDAVIARPGKAIKNVFFPIGAMVSVIVQSPDGLSVEGGHIGRQGCAGFPEAFGDGIAFFESVIQIAGQAYAMPVASFQREVDGNADLRRIMWRYNQFFVSLISQGSLCNRLHDVNHRLARWLLLCADGAGIETVHTTHEYLATMLGTHRPSVTHALNELETQCAIQASRGSIVLTDRKKLEETASPCYDVIRDEWQRLLGNPFAP